MTRSELLTGTFRGDTFWAKPNRMYKATGEFRKPLKGEYYLSGCDEQGKPTAYLAPNDLGYEYWIAVPVQMTLCKHCAGTGKVAKV